MRVEKDYTFDTDEGQKTLAELFDGPRSAPRGSRHVLSFQRCIAEC
jgi:hypothetical protein